jgi:DNA polymerase-3 subunit gamma/tau
MSYQVLARKWRPAKFEQMVGQSHVLMALTNALSQQRLHHAYLFTGTRGVGKTSLARLFAKGLNCETGVTATPCGECSSCIEIAQGRFVDLIEVDAASRTKVDDTRELLDNVQYRPSRGRFKVYLIDEVHMLSRSSFNALLKTLEEPPEHVKFFLATTDPQEKLPFELQALSLLAKAANGSMRDALSLTDQAIAFGSGQVMLTQVQTMLGSIDEQHVLALLKALCDADVGPLMQTVAKVLAFGADAEEVLRSLLELLHQITLTQFAPAAAQQSLFSEQILAFAQQLAPEQVQLYYQMLLSGRKDLPFAPDPKSGLEMALLRAVAFTPEKQVKRWVTTTPANIDLSVIDHSSTSAQEVIETGPKPDVLPQTHNDLTIAVPAIQAEELPTPEVEDIDVLDDIAVEPSLVAEQALLLDQAQSLGFNSLPPKSVDVQSDQLINDDVDKAAEADVVSATSSDDVVHNADTEATVESNTENLANDITESEEVAEQPTLVPSKADTNTVENSQSSDSADNSSLDAYSFMDYDEADDPSMEYQPSDHDEYVAFSVSNEITEANNVTEASESMSEPKTVNHLVDNNSDLMSDNARQNLTSADDNLDDFLDEVLASRDSLIADVGVLQQQEELAKKESTKTISSRVSKAAAASTSTSTTAANESSDKSEQAEFSAPTANEASSVTLNGIDKSKVVADYDRPPWVAPKEGEIVNAFADINQETKPAVEATFQPSSSVSQQAGHQHQKPASAQITRSLAADPQNINAEPVIQSNVLAKFEPHSIQGDEVDLHWYKIMTNVSVGGRVRQLGVNSVCPTLSNPIVLVLKPDQKHLSAQTAIDQLQVALSEYLERPTEVEIQIGVVQKRETPLELRKRFHRELIAQAQQSILLDDNVQWMIQHLSAQLDSDTIEYPSEQLGQIAQDIALISAS